MATNIKKVYNAFAGENLRSPELLREQSTSTETVNVVQTDNLGLAKRKGFQYQTLGQGGSGAVTFNRTDIASGVAARDRIVVDNNMHREVTSTITITYSGIGQANFSFLLNSDQVFELELLVDGDVVASQTFGNGKGDTEVGTNAVVLFINSVADFSAVDNGPGSNRAAFIDSVEFTTAPGDLTYKTFEKIPNATGVTDTFPLHWASRNDEDFELMQFAQTNNVLYVTNGKDGLFKYDGTLLYKAGLPNPDPLTLTPVAGSLTGSYVYRYFYEYTDAQGGIYRSRISSPQEIALTSNSVDITIPTVQDGSGYDTDGSNLKITLLRTRDNGTVLYEVATLANDGTVPSILFNDNTPDTSITVEFATPTNNPSEAPICRYIDVFRNKLILTGDPSNVNTVYFSDIESPEGFPVGNSFITTNKFGGPNSAVASQDNYLYIFKPNSISVVTGSLDTLEFSVDVFSEEGIGCVSANSILEAQGRIFFLSRQGIYSVFNAQPPTEESPQQKPYYNNPAFVALRVNCLNWIQERLLIWSLPQFDTINGEKVLNKDKTILVTLDLKTNAWFTWKNLDISSGISLDNESVWFSGRFNDTGNTVRIANAQLLELNTERDFADHDEPIEWLNATHWETLGEPAIDKNYNRVRIYSISEPLQGFTTTAFDLTLESNFNYSDGQVTTSTKDFGGGSKGWGEGPWGEFPWGDLPLAGVQFNLSRRKCKALRLVMKNNELHQNVLVTGYEIEVYAPYRLAIKGNV